MLEQNLFENVTFAYDYPFSFCRRNNIHTFPIHWHNFAELILAEHDGVVYEVNGEQFKMLKGDILLIHPCELHGLINNPDLKQSFLLMQFNYSLLMDLPNFKKYRFLFLNFRLLSYEKDPAFASELHELLSDMCICYEDKSQDFCDAQICSIFYRMFAKLGQWVLTENLTTGPDTRKKIHQSQTSPEMISVCSYISQHCCENPTLEEAALFAGFSRYHFSRLFHEFTGIPYVEFLSRAKLNIARQLLAEPTLSITDIALQSGFGSISSFNRCFQRYHNTTPSLFRTQFLKEEKHD